VVGWDKWREIEGKYGLGLLKQGLRSIAAKGLIDNASTDLYAHILLASLIEIAFLVSRSEDPVAAVEAAMKTVDAFLEKMAIPNDRT
jgi:hypothetical protein